MHAAISSRHRLHAAVRSPVTVRTVRIPVEPSDRRTPLCGLKAHRHAVRRSEFAHVAARAPPGDGKGTGHRGMARRARSEDPDRVPNPRREPHRGSDACDGSSDYGRPARRGFAPRPPPTDEAPTPRRRDDSHTAGECNEMRADCTNGPAGSEQVWVRWAFRLPQVRGLTVRWLAKERMPCARRLVALLFVFGPSTMAWAICVLAKATPPSNCRSSGARVGSSGGCASDGPR